MSLLDKLRERFESADLSKYTDFKVLLQYNIQQDGGVAAVFGEFSRKKLQIKKDFIDFLVLQIMLKIIFSRE